MFMHILSVQGTIKNVLKSAVSKNRLEDKIYVTDYLGSKKNTITGRRGLYLNLQNLIALVVPINKEFGKVVITVDEIKILSKGQVQDLVWNIQGKNP